MREPHVLQRAEPGLVRQVQHATRLIVRLADLAASGGLAFKLLGGVSKLVVRVAKEDQPEDRDGILGGVELRVCPKLVSGVPAPASHAESSGARVGLPRVVEAHTAHAAPIMPAMKVYTMSGSPFGWRVQLSLHEKGLAFETVILSIASGDLRS